MQLITLPFVDIPLNVSLQVGDMVYYSPLSTVGGGGFSTNGTIRLLGVISRIDLFPQTVIDVIFDETAIPLDELPTVDDYLMFVKDNKANVSSVTGYYAEAEFMNFSTDKIELFSVGSEISESSK